MHMHIHELTTAEALDCRCIVLRARNAALETSAQPGATVYLHLGGAANRQALREALDAADAAARDALREAEGGE